MIQQTNARFSVPAAIEASIRSAEFRLVDLVPTSRSEEMEDRFSFAKSQLVRGEIIHALDFYLELRECIYSRLTYGETTLPEKINCQELISAVSKFCERIGISGYFECDPEESTFIFFTSRNTEMRLEKENCGASPKIILSLDMPARLGFRESLQKLSDILTENYLLVPAFKVTGNQDSFLNRRENLVIYPATMDAGATLVGKLNESFKTDASIEIGFDFSSNGHSWSWNERQAQVVALFAFEKLFSVDLRGLLSAHGTPPEMFLEEEMIQLNSWLDSDPLARRI